MKRFFALFALILVAAIPLCLAGCKSKYDNLTIEMESSYEIVLGENENDSIIVEARVTGSSDENGGRLSFSPDNDKLVKISQDYKNGVNYITLKALAPGKVNIEARTLEGGVTKTFVVNIIQPIKNFTVKSGDFWVVRGGEWKIDIEKNLNLEPTNTTQTDFVVSFGANQDVTGLEIENNILKVAKDSVQDEIVLNVQSAANSDIAPKEIKLTVLDEFVEIDKATQATQSRFDDGDILVFEKNESMLTYDKLEELNIISNLLSESEKEVVVRVYSSKETDVNFESNSRLAVKKVSASKTYKTNGQIEYTDFVFSVRFADTVSSGAKTSINFVVNYVGFDFKKQLSSISVAYELAPKTLLVNDQDDLSEFTLYNFYSTAKKGQKLQFGVLPTSVSSENSKMMLLNKDNFENVFDYLQFFRSNGEEFFEGDTINAGEIVYARAKSGVRTGSFEVLLQTKYINPQTNAPLSKILKFNVLSGITEMNFENDEQVNIQLNSAQNSAEILFNVAPANIDITKIHVEEMSGLSFSTIAQKSQTAEGLTLRFVVEAKEVGSYKIKVYSENGIEITKDIRVINALDDVVLSVQSPNENSVVGDRQIISGELRYVAVSLGGAISLEESLSPNNSNYRVEYSYFEVDSMPEYTLSSYDYPNVVTSTSVGVLDYSQLLGYKKIVALKQGYAVVRAKYIPIGIVDNQDTELEPIYKYFVVQGYRPIRTVVMSSNFETLYSLKSVGVFNKHLTMTKVQLSIYPMEATYANSIVWDYDNSGEYFVFDEENLTVEAIKSYAGTISIIATIKELNRTYTQTLSITILDAKTVSDISVAGIGDSIYIENVDDTTKTFNINAVAFPNDAYNTKLRYDFVDQSGNVFGDIKISSDGLMTIPAGLGLSGYVRIAAEDCFQENSSTGEYQPVGTEGKNIILIPTVIANGTSKDTAIKINSKEELQKIDTKKHYKIQGNLNVSGISFENFSGGLYGYSSESRVVLSGFDRTFIQTLAKTGQIEDLQIDGNIELFGENGVLVGKNEGHINNVVATGNWSGSLGLVGTNAGRISNTTSEVVFDGEKFGGIALSNSGEIYNCSFMGSITASNQAAGIVVSNSGLLEVCSTLIVDGNMIKLSSTFATQAKIAGVCVENVEGGKILRTYIHSYKTDSAFVDSDFSHAAGFVHTNSGEITKCFSALLDSDTVTGFVYVNNAGATVENCYSNTTFANFNYGLITKCFSVANDERLNSSTSCYSGVNATEKTVSDWLKTDWDISCTYEKTTIWKIYLDSQNPFLREVSAEVKPESMTISIKEPQNSNSYIKLNETQVVLYRYETQVSPLTAAEKAKLNQYNSMSIYDLLTFEILPFNASSSPDMFDYSLTDGNALSVSGLNINVLGLGKQTLTITSKLNPELSFSLDIYTSYPIRDFGIYASASSLDPSGALTDGSIIYLKRTYTQALYSKISSSVVLVDREISFKTHDIKIDYASATESQPLGLYLLQFDEKQTIDEYTCSLNFADLVLYEEFEEIKATLPSCFARTFMVVVYNGAENLSASQYSFEMEPIDTICLEVTLTTDVSQEKEISYQMYNETGIDFTQYFAIGYNNVSKDVDARGFYVYKSEISIQLKERTTQISGNYYIRIYANEEEYTTFGIAPIDIEIKLLPQSIQRVDYSHYYASSLIENNKEVLEANPSPSNSLAPGQVGLLEINLFPTYSEISYVEIESIPNQDKTIKLQLYQRTGNDLNKFTMVQQNIDYSRTENGMIVGYSMINDGTIYVKTQVASDIPEEITFELVVRAYRSKQDQNPVEQHIFLAAKFIPTARVEVDGQKDYIVMGRGTTKDMTITVVGEGDVEIYAKDKVSSTNVYERAYVGQKTLTSTTNLGSQNQYVYTCPIFVGSKFKNDESDIVTIEVVVSREVNGVREKKTTTLVVRVLDFVVNKVVLTNGTDKYSSKVSVKTKFDFSYDITEPQSFTNDEDDLKAVKELKEKIKNFKKSQYFTTFDDENTYTYEKTFMYVDSLGDHVAATKNGENYSYKENEYVKFEDVLDKSNNYLYTTLIGLKTGTQKMKLQLSAKMSDKEIYSITYEFDVVVTNYSNEDKPMPIGSLDDFNAIFEQSDAQDYILTSDIEIGEHTPYADTSKIRSLDGNNHKITIKSLNIGTEQTLNVALFETISETTTIKNLIVDYQIGEINANSEQFSQINVAGLALNNEGIVTNTHVLSIKGKSAGTTGGIQISTAVSQSTQIEMAGFVLNNSGSITNSRVGDTSLTIIDTAGRQSEEPLKIFALVGQDQMAGFVLNNAGIISASYAKNITIVNNSKFETDNKTAGFVLNNQSGAKITGSYVRGVDGVNKSEIYVEGQGIESSFEVAGFVYDNFSYISDCYSNIKLYKETPLENRKGVRSAGFVYRNEIGAQIVSSLSLSKIVEDDTSQEQFCGVDSENQSNNFGTITYSYYYSKLGKFQSIADGAELLNASAVKLEDHYYGYSFTSLGALDGMWTMTTRGPELVSANNIALSKRYLISTEEDKYDVAYVAGFEYGSVNNPILIRSAQEFNDVFGTSKDDSIKQYFDASKKQAFGNYRIINDIDLSDLSLGGSETTTLSSTAYTFMRKTDEFGGVVGHGVLEGNSMTISNLDFSITDTDQIYFGLFSSIKNGAVVKNLNLTVKEISASSVNYVGALAGYVENSKIINVSATIAQNQQIALVQGRNVVGGVVGAVAGTSELNNITSSVSAHATYVDTKEASKVNQKGDNYVQVAVPTLPTEGSGLNSTVSIAGSVAGAIYAKDINDPTNANLSTIVNAQIKKIKASGKFTVSAKIAGGLVGYVGRTTYLHDAWLAISDGQNINAYNNGVAGGAVGVSYGKLSHIRIEHNDIQNYTISADNLQKEIEENVVNYYENKSNERKTYENMFNSSNFGQTLGGIVGVMNGGYLEDSYTKLDVISDSAYNLGGIVGIIKNQKYEISRVYTFSNVQSKSTIANTLVGGLFGAVLSSGELDTVVGVNYLDKNYKTTEDAKDKFVTFEPFAGACTYVPAMSNVYTLDSIYGMSDKQLEIKGADISSSKSVATLKTNFKILFPANINARHVNEVFEIEDSHFKNAYWARNVDDVLPHLTFGLEEQYYIIDDIETANDIRKMLKNSNKTFYIDGRVNMNSAEVIRAVKEVRESIIFTGKILGIPSSMNPRYNPSEVTPTLVGMQELFNQAVGATFADFVIENPQNATAEMPSSNFGSLLGSAKDCVFSNIKVVGQESTSSISANFSNNAKNTNVGGLVGLSEGKSSFENIVVENINIQAGNENNIGLVVGKLTSTYASTTFRNCEVKNSSIKSIEGSTAKNTNVGGLVGSADGVVITSNQDAVSFDGISISVVAENVGGIAGAVSGSANLNTLIARIQINVGGSAQNVGGIVGTAGTLSMTMSSNVILTSESMIEEDYGKIEASGGEELNVGGIAGKVQSASISSTSQQNVKFQTNDISANGTDVYDVYAGGLVGQATNSISISNVLVNTQGKIKNKVMKISCSGNVYAGGIVGSTADANIENCWSGTDVEVDEVTAVSQVTFGGITGNVSEAQSGTSIKDNVSYGRFYLNSDVNIESINAGGIVGYIKTSEQTTIGAITNNKSLTSLEIRRRATTHNVNAIAGSRSNISGSGNAYTYQLSISVESDTDFATNCNTWLGVGVSDASAEKGSILNPHDVVNGHSLDMEGYYKIEETSTDVKTLNISSANDFVLIGNGKTIKLTGSHIDTIGNRTIISGVTIQGAFQYDVADGAGAAEVKIGDITYTYSPTELKNGDTVYKFSNEKVLGEWTAVQTSTRYNYFYLDEAKQKVYIGDLSDAKETTIDGKKYLIVSANGATFAVSAEDDTKIYNYSETTEDWVTMGKILKFSENDIGDYFEYNGKLYLAQFIDKSGILYARIWIVDGDGMGQPIDVKADEGSRKTFVKIDDNLYEKNNLNNGYLVVDGKSYEIETTGTDSSGKTQYQVVVEPKSVKILADAWCLGVEISENGTTIIKKVEETDDGYYLDETKLEEKDNKYYLNATKVDIFECVELDGKLYAISEDESGTYLVDGENKYLMSTATAESVSKECRELGKDSIMVMTLDGILITVSEEKTKIDGTEYIMATVAGQNYVINSDNSQVAKILNQKTVKIGEKTYIYQAGYLIEKDSSPENKYSISSGSSNENAYERAQGFVTTNNGFISGVVVKSNYYSSDFGGFVTTNNGTILYSSMNGQVYATGGNVAGFVLENNGIIDYCHSTGAVQGEVGYSYSFGANNPTGALTNSYTIMLNETTNTISHSSRAARKAAINPDFEKEHESGGGSSSGESSSVTVPEKSTEGKYVFANNEGKAFSNNEYDPIATEINCGQTKADNSVVMNNTLKGCFIDEKDVSTNGFWADHLIKDGEIAFNYGYKTLSNGAFSDILHLSINTGNGSKENPYAIANSRMLRNINEISLSAAYVLTNNIDLRFSDFSKETFLNPNWAMIGLTDSFTGLFNGNNKTIANLTYANYSGAVSGVENTEFSPKSKDDNNTPTSETIFGGLFAKTAGATIENIKLSTPAVSVATKINDGTHNAFAGALIGYAENSTIKNVVVSDPNVKAYGNDRVFVGALIGYIDCQNNNSTVQNCSINQFYQSENSSYVSSYNNYSSTIIDGGKSQLWVGFSSEDNAKKHLSAAGQIVGVVEGKKEFSFSGNSSTIKTSSHVANVHVLNTNTTDMLSNEKLNVNDFAPAEFGCDFANAHKNLGAARDEYIEISSSASVNKYSAYKNKEDKMYYVLDGDYSQFSAQKFTYSLSTEAILTCKYKYDKSVYNKDGESATTRLHVRYYRGMWYDYDITEPDNWTGDWKLEQINNETQLNHRVLAGKYSKCEASKEYGERYLIVYAINNGEHTLGIPASYLKPTITDFNGVETSNYKLYIEHYYNSSQAKGRNLTEKVYYGDSLIWSKAIKG